MEALCHSDVCNRSRRLANAPNRDATRTANARTGAGGGGDPGTGGDTGREGVPAPLYPPGRVHAPRFFPGVRGAEAGIIKLVECLPCATHCPG